MRKIDSFMKETLWKRVESHTSKQIQMMSQMMSENPKRVS